MVYIVNICIPVYMHETQMSVSALFYIVHTHTHTHTHTHVTLSLSLSLSLSPSQRVKLTQYIHDVTVLFPNMKQCSVSLPVM